ncbi:MAG: aldo/keto reductase [Bryobacteraceae bacterium]|nr:aldo/keto reductase [Bryobacteraceae bacterium]
MKRRTFLQVSSVVAGAGALSADAPMPMATLGKSGLKVSRFCLGGYHMAVRGEEEAIRIIHRAIELGVNFFDSAHHYHKGKSDEIYGKALRGGLRQKVLLMSKAQLRDRDSAMRQLEETLTRMRTDYLDLWQCHEVSTQQEVDKILGPGGALEAFVRAKEQGKVRHIGFTGHHDPAVHKRLLESFDGWETVQMPVNLIDPHYLSFIRTVLPEARKKGLGVLAMKTNGMGSIGKHRIASISECLRFAWSQDVDTVVSGVETVGHLLENVGICKTFQPMSKQEISVLLHRTKQGPTGSKVENYKKKENASMTHKEHRDGEPA